MLLSEIAYSIYNTAKGGGVASDDTRLNIALIKYWVQYYRNFMIPIATDYGKIYMPELVQDLGCVALTEVDKAECAAVGGTTITWGCNIMKATIPALVDMPKDRGLVFVGLINKQTPIEVCTAENVGLSKHRLISNNKPKAYRIGTTIYVDAPAEKRMSYINVRGIFEDPTKVETCTAGGSCACFNEDTDQYPMPDTLIPKITELIMTKELQMALTVVDDKNNDGDEAYAKR